MKKTLFLLIIAFALSDAYAQTRIEALGIADIHKNFVQIARDRATDNAKRLAVEKAVRTFIQSETLVENYALVYDRIFSRSSGYINAFEVLEERREGDQYLVKIRADVGSERLKDDVDRVLKTLLTEKAYPRVMILFQERAQKDFVAEGTMTEYFLSKGFRMVNSATVRESAPPESLMTLGVNKDAAYKMGSTYGAEIIIIGSVATSSHPFKMGDVEIHANRANVAAKVIKSDTGEIMASAAEEHKSPGIKDMVKGPVEEASRKLAEVLIKKVVAWWQKELSSTVNVKLIIQGFESYDELSAFKERFPEEARGIQNVYQRQYDQGRLELDVDLKGKTHFLANDLVHFRLNNKSFVLERESPGLLQFKLAK